MATESMQELIGKVVRRVRLPVEAGKIEEFARAIKDDSPRYLDSDAAHEEGFSDIPAPLTFSVALAHHPVGDSSARSVAEICGLDRSRVLHGESTWEYHRTPVAGGVLEGETKIADIVTKEGRRGGEMILVTAETVLKDEAGIPVITLRSTSIQTEAAVSG